MHGYIHRSNDTNIFSNCKCFHPLIHLPWQFCSFPSSSVPLHLRRETLQCEVLNGMQLARDAAAYNHPGEVMVRTQGWHTSITTHRQTPDAIKTAIYFSCQIHGAVAGLRSSAHPLNESHLGGEQIPSQMWGQVFLLICRDSRMEDVWQSDPHVWIRHAWR